MRVDFDKLQDGQEIMLVPNYDNPIHWKPVKAVYQRGYFYCEGTDPVNGPDYYMGDVLKYNIGFTDCLDENHN